MVDNSVVKNNPKKRFKTAHNEVNISHSQPHPGPHVQQPLPVPSRPRNFEAAKKQFVLKEMRKIVLKELNLEHIKYLPQESVGSGSHGQCYCACYSKHLQT